MSLELRELSVKISVERTILYIGTILLGVSFSVLDWKASLHGFGKSRQSGRFFNG